MKGKNEGYNADKDEYGDLVAAGVIDPGEGRSHRSAKRAPASRLCCSPPTRSSPKFPRKKKKAAAATITTTTAWVEWVAWAAWEWAAWVAWAA